MHCTKVKIGDTYAIICGSSKIKVCCYCSSLMDVLCDFPIEGKKTCDRPMCKEHAAHYGKNFDYCREHKPDYESTAPIIVVNLKHGILGEYIGRHMKRVKGSPLGNPFKVGYHTDPLGQYKRWLWEQIKQQTAAYQELCRLRDIVKKGEQLKLACWCHPAPCHADIVKAAIEWMMKEGESK